MLVWYLLAVHAAVTVTSTAAKTNRFGSKVSQYSEVDENYGEGGYSEDYNTNVNQDLSLAESDVFREYIVHEEGYNHFIHYLDLTEICMRSNISIPC